MSEKPILFNSEMVRAILEGRKTQTRRIIKMPFNEFAGDERVDLEFCLNDDGWRVWEVEYPEEGSAQLNCPYGKVGDKLWVRETFSKDATTMYPCPKFWYKADAEFESDGVHSCKPEHRGQCANCLACWEEVNGKFKWTPSIHMPRFASRITLEITNIRVDRLQDISEEDAKAEGVKKFDHVGKEQRIACDTKDRTQLDSPYTVSFACLWSEINGPESWVSNPWVWVIEFKKAEGA